MPVHSDTAVAITVTRQGEVGRWSATVVSPTRGPLAQLVGHGTTPGRALGTLGDRLDTLLVERGWVETGADSDRGGNESPPVRGAEGG